MKKHYVSDCCSAPVINGCVCSECREICLVVKHSEEEPNDREIAALIGRGVRPLDPLENWQRNYRRNVS